MSRCLVRGVVSDFNASPAGIYIDIVDVDVGSTVCGAFAYSFKTPVVADSDLTQAVVAGPALLEQAMATCSAGVSGIRHQRR